MEDGEEGCALMQLQADATACSHSEKAIKQGVEKGIESSFFSNRPKEARGTELPGKGPR